MIFSLIGDAVEGAARRVTSVAEDVLDGEFESAARKTARIATQPLRDADSIIRAASRGEIDKQAAARLLLDIGAGAAISRL